MTDAPEAPRQIWLVTTPGAYVEDEVYRHGLEPGAVEYVRADLAAGYVIPEAHAAALREAWEAGRDAAAHVAVDAAEQSRKQYVRLTRQKALEAADVVLIAMNELLAVADKATALTPPVPKGDDR